MWCAVAAAGARTAAPVPAPPVHLPVRAAILIEQGSGAVLFAQHADAELAIASTTKLMTAWVTVEELAPGARLVEQPYVSGVGESLAPVAPGTTLTVTDMLRAMLLPSGNNVAYSLALDVGGSESTFVSMMNAWAWLLGLGRTHFTTPIGLDTPPGNYSTALDLARLARVVIRNRLIKRIVDEFHARLANGVTVKNLNDLVGAYPWIVGMKTGSTTNAGYCLVAAASSGGIHLISVVLGAPSKAVRDRATLELLRYGLRLEHRATLVTAGRLYATVAVRGRRRNARLVASRSVTVVLARSASVRVSHAGVPARLTGPLRGGHAAGAVEAFVNGRRVASVALVTAAAVPAPWPVRPARAVLPWISAAGGGGLLAVLLGCSLLVMRRRARRIPPGGLG